MRNNNNNITLRTKAELRHDLTLSKIIKSKKTVLKLDVFIFSIITVSTILLTLTF